MEVVNSSVEDVYALSPPQLDVFERTRFDPDSVSIHQIVQTLPSVDGGILERAWQGLVDRDPVLRTSIQWQGLERPVQVVHRELPFTLERRDWNNVSVERYRRDLSRFLEEDRLRGMTLESAPLFRVTLFASSDGMGCFVWSYHSIILDAGSTSLILADLSTLYAALSREQPPPLTLAPRYREFIAWVRKQDPRNAEDFWRERWRDFTRSTPLPLSRKDADGGFQEQRFGLGIKLTTKLREYAARENLKVSTLFRGAWAILLGCHGGTNEVVFGEVFPGRPATLKGVQRMVGRFAHTLPVRVRMSVREEIPNWLHALETDEERSRPFRHVALTQIHAWSGLPANAPFFESVLHLEKRPAAVPDSSSESSPFPNNPVHRPAGSPDYPLVIGVAPSIKHGLSLKASTLNSRYQPGVGYHLLRDYRTVLARMVGDPQPKLNDLHRVISPLIPIQTQGSQSPVFFVHPAGGSAANYYALSEVLGADQPFFAFEARGGNRRHHDRVESLAAYYLAALRRVYPNGPYRLGGWSLGALVAFEMARALHRQGRHVTQVTMLDPPVEFQKRHSEKRENASPLIRFARSHGISLREKTLEKVPEHRRYSFLLNRCKRADLVVPETTVTEFQRQVHLFLSHTKAVQAYAPAVYPGRVIFVRAEESKAESESTPGGDWTSVVPDLEVFFVPGSHRSMMRPPHLDALAEKLRSTFRG